MMFLSFQKLDASSISINDLGKYFGEIHYVGCDTLHTNVQIGGDTWQEVLKNLLDDVQEFELSRTSDEIVNMVTDFQATPKCEIYTCEQEGMFSSLHVLT